MFQQKLIERIERLWEFPDDYSLIGLSAMQNAYSEPEVKRQMALMIRVLIGFMDEHGLTNHWLINPSGAIPEEFVLRKGDLTKDGLLFYALAEKKWMSAHDRGVSITDTGILVRTLKEIREWNWGKANSST
jgi:hypothetical protein